MGRMTPAVSLLEREGVQFELLEYDHGKRLSDFGLQAADALELPADQVFKTLVLSVDDGHGLVVVVVPVSCTVSMKRTATAIGAKRAQMCERAVAERVTGYVIGGISPLGQRTVSPTLIDESAELYDTIYVSGGRRGLDIALDPTDLVRLLGATVAAITA